MFVVAAAARAAKYAVRAVLAYMMNDDSSQNNLFFINHILGRKQTDTKTIAYPTLRDKPLLHATTSPVIVKGPPALDMSPRNDTSEVISYILATAGGETVEKHRQASSKYGVDWAWADNLRVAP